MKNIFRGIIAFLLVAAGLFVANGIAQADFAKAKELGYKD